MSTSSLSLTPAFGHFTWLLVQTASNLSQLEFQAPAEASQASLLASVFLLFNLIFYFFLFFRQKIEHLKETTCVSQRMNTFSFLLGLEVTSFLINCSVIFPFQSMVESIKHCIVLLQIAKVSTARVRSLQFAISS